MLDQNNVSVFGNSTAGIPESRIILQFHSDDFDFIFIVVVRSSNRAELFESLLTLFGGNRPAVLLDCTAPRHLGEDSPMYGCKTFGTVEINALGLRHSEIQAFSELDFQSARLSNKPQFML